jgi:hypothetical protein
MLYPMNHDTRSLPGVAPDRLEVLTYLGFGGSVFAALRRARETASMCDRHDPSCGTTVAGRA